MKTKTKQDGKCYKCGTTVKVGARCDTYQERALSYREASAVGGWRVTRLLCAQCAQTRAEHIAKCLAERANKR